MQNHPLSGTFSMHNSSESGASIVGSAYNLSREGVKNFQKAEYLLN